MVSSKEPPLTHHVDTIHFKDHTFMIDEDELLQTISKLNADNEEPRRESRAYNYGSGGG